MARAPHDHGTAEQAIEWVVHESSDSGLETHAFLKEWQEGSAEAEWPDFYAWLDKQDAKAMPT